MVPCREHRLHVHCQQGAVLKKYFGTTFNVGSSCGFAQKSNREVIMHQELLCSEMKPSKKKQSTVTTFWYVTFGILDLFNMNFAINPFSWLFILCYLFWRLHSSTFALAASITLESQTPTDTNIVQVNLPNKGLKCKCLKLLGLITGFVS